MNISNLTDAIDIGFFNAATDELITLIEDGELLLMDNLLALRELTVASVVPNGSTPVKEAASLCH